jgi:hypothetical protein
MHFLALIHKFLILWKTFRVSNIFHPISKFEFGFNQILITHFVGLFSFFFFFIFVFYMINTFQVPLSFWNSFFSCCNTDSFLQYLAWQRTSFGLLGSFPSRISSFRTVLFVQLSPKINSPPLRFFKLAVIAPG